MKAKRSPPVITGRKKQVWFKRVAVLVCENTETELGKHFQATGAGMTKPIARKKNK
jgi:hypothetical protein